MPLQSSSERMATGRSPYPVMNAQRGAAEGLGAGGAPEQGLEFSGQKQLVATAEAGGNRAGAQKAKHWRIA
jgi:hypothetical protein